MAFQQPIAASFPMGLPYFASDQSRAAFNIASVGWAGAACDTRWFQRSAVSACAWRRRSSGLPLASLTAFVV